MSPGWCHWSLGSILLLLGGSLAVHVQIHRGSVNGTVGRAVLLPVSYRFDGAPRFPVSVSWTFPNSSAVLITCTVLNCSLGAGGVPSSCSANFFPSVTHRGRAELFPENGSLLLRDLRLGDSGVYSVTFRPPYGSWPLTLTVHEPRFAPQHPADAAEQSHLRDCVAGISSSASLLLLGCCACRWARRRKRRIAKRPQVSGVEEPRTEGTAGGDVGTIYATVGDSFQPPEVVYTSMPPPGPPARDAGAFHLLV